MTEGAAGRRRICLLRHARVDDEPVDPARDGRLCEESESRRSEPSKRWRDGATRSSDHLGGAGLSALQRRSGHQAPCEDGPPADPLRPDEPPDASSSPRSSHAWQPPAVATMLLQSRGEATTWMTLTCRSSPPPRWPRRRSTTAPVMGLLWRRRRAPSPSTF
jgi:hypothetical protein